MYIINTSFMIEPAVHGQWYEFITKKFIPYLKSVGYEEIIFTKVLSENIEKHHTYSIQIPLETIPDYQKYVNEIFDEYISIAKPIFGANVVYVNTLMKKVQC
ncbi:MAG: DUF4286 family protein [Rikenellaceae bacterium]